MAGSTSTASGQDLRLADPAVQSNTLQTKLDEHSRGRRLDARSKRLFIRHLEISILVAVWTVVLATPVFIWPLGEWMWNFSCQGLDYSKCLSREVCGWQRSGWFVFQGACITKYSGHLSLWGTLMLQFLFSIHADRGSTVRLTMQGTLGTALAWANMALLNGVFGFWLGGGAHAQSMVVRGNPELVNSRWLPLCNDGFNTLVDPGATCFFNVWVDQLTWPGVCKVAFVYLDFTIFVVLCLATGFDSNTRMFALSMHVCWMMSFLNPGTDGFVRFPTVHWNYMGMVLTTSLVSIGCFFFPRPRFSALEASEKLSKEASEAVDLLLEAMPNVTDPLTRLKAASALAETKVVLADLDKSLKAAFFEDFGWGERADRRHSRQHHSACLRASIAHLSTVYHCAALVEEEELQATQFQRHLLTVRNLCRSMSEALHREPCHNRQHAPGAVDFTSAAANFATLRGDFSASARSFFFVLYGVLSDTKNAVSAEQPAASGRKLHERLGIRWLDRSATHPRFVLRNTFSICVAFALGWVGMWNTVAAYSSYPATTIAVIMYTYTGTNAPLTLKRVAGVVLGTVLGTIVQLHFAVKNMCWDLVFAAIMFSIVALLFFLYLHMDKDIAQVCRLAVGFAASSMIPASFHLRDVDQQTFTDIVPVRMNTFMSIVLGVAILTTVDEFMGSKVTNQARQRLLRALNRAEQLVQKLSSKSTHQVDGFYEDLNVLRKILPCAAAEPSYWRQPFKLELYSTLEGQLRRLGSHAEALAWALKLTNAQGNYTGHDALQSSGKQFSSELKDMYLMAVAVTRPDEDAEGWVEVLEHLEASLYTVRAVRLLACRCARLVRFIFPRCTATPAMQARGSSQPLEGDAGGARRMRHRRGQR